MSIHQSLKLKDQLSRNRNVLTRVERIEIMRKRKTLAPEKGDSIFGLPKLRLPKS